MRIDFSETELKLGLPGLAADESRTGVVAREASHRPWIP